MTRGFWLAVAAVALGYAAVPNARPDFGRYNAHDSESYLALSYGMVHGLGYTRSMIAGQYVPHTIWAPGLPALVAPSVAASGLPLDWRLVKMNLVLVALGGLVAAGLLAARVTGSRSAGPGVVLLVGLNPFYWYFGHRVMIEAPLTAAILVSALLVDHVWAGRRPRALEAAAAGILAGLSLLIRGHAIGLLLAPLAYLWGRRRSIASRREFSLTFVVYAVLFVVPYGAWAVRCATTDARGYDGMSQLQMLTKQAPNDPSSPQLTPLAVVRQTLHNLRTYVPYNIVQQVVPAAWPDRLWAWRGSGFVSLGLALLLIVIAFTSTRTACALQPAAAAIFAINAVFAYGGNPRYWLSFSTITTVLLAMRYWHLLEASKRTASLVAIGALACNLAFFVSRHEVTPYNSDGPWAEYAGFLESLRDTPVRTAGILAPNPQALQLTTGLPAPLIVADNDPQVDHVVLRSDRRSGALPPGARLVREHAPWQLWALAHPARTSALHLRIFGAGD